MFGGHGRGHRCGIGQYLLRKYKYGTRNALEGAGGMKGEMTKGGHKNKALAKSAVLERRRDTAVMEREVKGNVREVRDAYTRR